jgi:opacity protein-like surface antigen
MKKFLPFFVLALFLLNFSFAQDARKIQIILSGGISIPSSPTEFTDYWNLGFNGGGGIGYIFSPNFSANAYFDFNTMSLNEDKFLNDLGAPPGVSIEGGSINVITVMANVKGNLITKPKSVSPYFKAGIGLFSLSATDVTVSYQGQSQTVSVDASEEALGIIFGGGIDFPVSPTVLVFVEGNYCVGFTEDESTSFIPIKGGVIILL